MSEQNFIKNLSKKPSTLVEYVTFLQENVDGNILKLVIKNEKDVKVSENLILKFIDKNTSSQSVGVDHPSGDPQRAYDALVYDYKIDVMLYVLKSPEMNEYVGIDEQYVQLNDEGKKKFWKEMLDDMFQFPKIEKTALNKPYFKLEVSSVTEEAKNNESFYAIRFVAEGELPPPDSY